MQIVCFVDAIWLAIILDFCAVQTYWALNEVARDLEGPFVYDPNDLPLARYQVRKHYSQCMQCVSEDIQQHHKHMRYQAPACSAFPCIWPDLAGFHHYVAGHAVLYWVHGVCSSAC